MPDSKKAGFPSRQKADHGQRLAAPATQAVAMALAVALSVVGPVLSSACQDIGYMSPPITPLPCILSR